MVNAVLGMDYDLSQTIAKIQTQLRDLATQPILLNASTGQDGGKGLTTDKDGLHVFNPAGDEVARIETSDGAFVHFDADGNEIARYGLLTHTDVGAYGAEVLVGGTWVQLGAQTSTWGTLSGIPADFAPLVTSAVANATNAVNATNAATASEADGTTTAAFNRDIAGIPGTYKAMWMHSTNVIGYNTSDEKYKRNIRDLHITPEQLLELRAVLYDRKATGADDYTPAVQVDELGLIAGEVADAIPELALRFNGEIDSVFYERIGVVLLPFVQQHERVIAEQAAQIEALTTAVRQLGGDI